MRQVPPSSALTRRTTSAARTHSGSRRGTARSRGRFGLRRPRCPSMSYVVRSAPPSATTSKGWAGARPPTSTPSSTTTRPAAMPAPSTARATSKSSCRRPASPGGISLISTRRSTRARKHVRTIIGSPSSPTRTIIPARPCRGSASPSKLRRRWCNNPSRERAATQSCIISPKAGLRASVENAAFAYGGAGQAKRRHLQFPQHAFAQSFGIALARFRKCNNLTRDDLVGDILVGQSEGRQGHLEPDAQHPERFKIEFATLQECPDRPRNLPRSAQFLWKNEFYRVSCVKERGREHF